MLDVIDNPYGPPAGGPPPRGPRRGWPSWSIAMIGIVGGLVLMAPAAVVVLGVAAADHGDRYTSSGSGSVAPPGGSASSPSPSSPSSGPQPDPGVGTGREQLDLDFPDGTTGSIAVPTGMSHFAGGDSTGHVAMWSDDGSADLDIYTDSSAAARRGDLRAVAAAERSTEAGHGGRVSAISYGKIGGHRVAQFTDRTHGKYADQTYDNLVTVMLVGHQSVVVYFSDHPGTYVSARAHRDTASLLRSLHAQAGDAAGGTTT